MNKIDMFKEFVHNNTFLIDYIRNGEKTWQDMYEMYDLYGEDEDAWSKFLIKEDKDKHNNYFEEFVNIIKRVDVDKVQEGINSLQKTLGLFGDLFKGHSDANTSSYNPRPLYRRFED